MLTYRQLWQRSWSGILTSLKEIASCIVGRSPQRKSIEWDSEQSGKERLPEKKVTEIRAIYVMMRGMRKVIIFLIISVLLTLPTSGFAVYFASDKIYVFENGKQIATNSVLWKANYQTFIQICKQGLCDIGQQFYPVTIFKTNEENLLTEEQWKIQYYLEHKDCEGYITRKAEIEQLHYEYLKTSKYKKLQEEARKEAISKRIADIGFYVAQKIYDAEVDYIRSKGFSFYESDICRINNDAYAVYLTNLITTAKVYKTFNPDPLKDEKGCSYLGCIGEKIGDSRIFNFEITTGRSRKINSLQTFIMNYMHSVGTFLMRIIKF